MAKEYVVKILGWKKYQTREVKTRTSWFRLENDFIENPNFCEFTSDERIVWMYALCCASKLNHDSLHVPDQCSHRVLNRCTGIDEKTFHRTFEKLKKLRIVEIRTTRGRYTDDTFENADDTLRDETRRNEDETETRRDDNETAFDFESAYNRFPRKEGKSKGIKKLQTEIKTQEDFDRLVTAIENYAASRRGQDQTFTKHFSTFVSEWRDWIDYKPSDAPPQPYHSNPAYRRMAGNQAALAEALAAMEGVDE
jgi:hypothetical protein